MEILNRREFLVQLAVITGSLTLSCAKASSDADGTWTAIGLSNKFKEGTFTYVVLPDAFHRSELYIQRQSDGTYLALLARCTHKGCTVEWDPGKKSFICPCHSGRFDQTGKNVSGPPSQPLTPLKTKTDNKGSVYVLVTPDVLA